MPNFSLCETQEDIQVRVHGPRNCFQLDEHARIKHTLEIELKASMMLHTELISVSTLKAMLSFYVTGLATRIGLWPSTLYLIVIYLSTLNQRNVISISDHRIMHEQCNVNRLSSSYPRISSTADAV